MPNSNTAGPQREGETEAREAESLHRAVNLVFKLQVCLSGEPTLLASVLFEHLDKAVLGALEA